MIVVDKRGKRIEEIINSGTDRPQKKAKEKELSSNIEKNINLLKDIIGFSDDVVFRFFRLGNKLGIKAIIIFIDGLVDKQTINESILQPLLIEEFSVEDIKELSNSDMISFIEKNTMTINELEIVDKLDDLIQGLLNGDTVLLIDGYKKGFVLNSKGWDKRGVQEPESETVIRGPRDGFTETLRVNTALIRRRIKHPALRIKGQRLGNISNTDVVICYIEGIANKYIVEEVKERVNNISIDAVQESGYIEQLIEDNHFTLFPQILSTERPDRVASNLLEGRVALLVDGTPFALIMPVTISIFLQSPEDYYDRFIIGTFVRLLRFSAGLIALTLPAVYIAVIAFHPEMIPTQLALAFAGGRGAVPFPSYIEAFVMTALMELLREGSLRLPNPIGPTIGIVGALIIGEAAVSASIVSPFMVIVVATTTIASFAIPDYSSAIALRLIKFPLMILTSIFGLYGLLLGLIFFTIHLASLKSFGIPYLTPFGPSRLNDLQDAIIRIPLWQMFKRPEFLRTKNQQRFSAKGDDDQNERTR
ncbi:spore germination protein [Iocasia frigidifontis]|uniref:spore germination protein n=1 Tax=Iocasia fonsfrigidae TaxID=2682810 RepID=UPI001E35EA63|nr:spore germination protein [Iocasia fonsfrigidae]